MVFVVDDSVEVALCDVIDDVLVEMFGRFRAAALVPFDAAQVVDDVAAGPDEVAFFTERGEFLAECEALVRRKQAVYGKLDDWDGRVRKHMDHNTPCSVVDAPRNRRWKRRCPKAGRRPGSVLGSPWPGIGADRVLPESRTCRRFAAAFWHFGCTCPGHTSGPRWPGWLWACLRWLERLRRRAAFHASNRFHR